MDQKHRLKIINIHPKCANKCAKTALASLFETVSQCGVMISSLNLDASASCCLKGITSDARWQGSRFEIAGHRVYAITGNALDASDLGAPLQAILAGLDAVPTAQYVFGNTPKQAFEATVLSGQSGGRAVPAATPLLSTQLYAVSPAASVAPVVYKGRKVGVSFGDAGIKCCLLGDITADDPAASHEVQCRQFFENTEGALAVAGFKFTDIVRTWLYADAILTWYDTLNRVRTQFFNERGVFEKRVPASTGIGAANSHGTAIVASLLAVAPAENPVEQVRSAPLSIRPLRSPLQCSAEDYGSSFSRAIEVAGPDDRSRGIFISGTASIEPGGKTVHVGDVEKQISLTMDVVEAILGDRGLGWAHVGRAIAYFRDLKKDESCFRQYLAGRELTALPVVCVQADVCRDDLLFEIEADAFSAVHGA